MNVLHQTRVSVSRSGLVHRRDFLRGVSASALAAGALSWTDLVSVHAAELRKRGMACILLWMQGGPSQFETFDPKPAHENGGETKAIKTNVPGIEIAENLPNVAQVMDRIALIRSMTTKEGNHQRASFLLHTGYVPTNSVKHPTLGALVAQQIADHECELPHFVRIGGRFANGGAGGILGVDYDPFVLDNAERLPANTQLTTDSQRYRRRLDLLGRLEADYAATGGQREVDDHQKLYAKTAKMVLSPQMKAFDLSREPDPMREAYGRTQFGAGCLMARRLIEEGLTFVEVGRGNWDTHDNNFERSKTLAGQLDQPYAQLLRDLAERGLLESTLVIWMGEFGRTPRINPRGGRDHYPRAFSVALAGGGVKGQVIGRTDAGGADVKERPVGVADLFQTFCKSLKLDPSKENMSSIGRPIRVVDGGQAVDEVFG
jgi:hypothetical protein